MSLSASDFSEIEKLLVEINRGASRGDRNRLEGLQRLALKTDKTMVCFDTGTVSRNFENLFDTSADEMARRRGDSDRLNRFWLVEMPIMLSTAITKCDIDPTVISDFEVTLDLARRGLASGFGSALSGFYGKGRGQYIKRVLKSANHVKAGALLENVAVRQGTTYLAELLAKSITPTDFEALGYIATGLVIDNLTGVDLDNWLKVVFREPTLTKLRTSIADLPENRRNLLNLISTLEHAGSFDEVGIIRQVLAADPAISATESASTTLIETAFKQELRAQLKVVAKKLVETWANMDGGWGSLLDVVGGSVALAGERPVQDALCTACSPTMKIMKLLFHSWFVTPMSLISEVHSTSLESSRLTEIWIA
jgi:hypothetical protein